MTTKLTLTINDEVISSAKKYAQNNGKSLSHIIENYLKSITTQDSNQLSLSPKVTNLMGAIKLPNDFDYKKDLSAALVKKYK